MKYLEPTKDCTDGNATIKHFSSVKEVSSHSNRHFLLQNNDLSSKGETLKTELQQYVPSTGLIFPLSLKSGPSERTGTELTGVETNVAYDPRWTPAGLFGSPLFDLNIGSKITYDFTDQFSSQNQMTISFWIHTPKVHADRFVLVSFYPWEHQTPRSNLEVIL